MGVPLYYSLHSPGFHSLFRAVFSEKNKIPQKPATAPTVWLALHFYCKPSPFVHK